MSESREFQELTQSEWIALKKENKRLLSILKKQGIRLCAYCGNPEHLTDCRGYITRGH